MHSTAQQQPTLSFDDLPIPPTFTEELGPSYFIHRSPRMPQNMEFVIHDAALRHPLLQALTVGLPHCPRMRPKSTGAETRSCAVGKLVQPLLLAPLAEPHRFASLQIADYGEKLLLLPQMDLIDAHQPQSRLLATPGPALQIPQIDRSNRAGGQAKLSPHSPYRSTFAGLAHRASKRLLKGALLGNCGTFSALIPHFGQCTRYNSITTVIEDSKHGRSCTSRS